MQVLRPMSPLFTRYVLLSHGNVYSDAFLCIRAYPVSFTYNSRHKQEDTLACILALDGFFIDGRNIRASYGTSKYCSAFIKNVRCNNPECTYLHCMGDAEDTFTKQEIQAGYVTSGRDVLARQQQIVAEQLSAGATGAGTRRKVGGGGPSGTGKASANPVFPPPVYDEPLKQSTSTLVPPPAQVSRSKSVGGGTTPPVAPAVQPAGKIGRSVSVSSGSASPAVAATTTRKGSITAAAPVATAASVVAGMHSIGSTAAVEPPAAHTTLTPLTPLKRTAKGKSTSTISQDATDTRQQRDSMSKLSSLRNGGKSSSLKNGLYGAAPPSPSSSVSSSGKAISSQMNDFSVGSIGGTALGPPDNSAVGGTSLLGSSSSIGNPIGSGSFGGSGVLGGQPIGTGEPLATSSSLGGEIFTGQLPQRSDSAIGNHNDKWNSAAPVDRGSGLFGSSSSLSIGGGDIWGNESGGGMAVGGGRAPGAGVFGGSNSSLGSIGPGDGGVAPGGHFSSNSGSSALASMLGINLPTGTGSLRESSTLWNGPSSSQAPSSVASLNGSSAPGVIGSVTRAPGGGISAISGSGGMPINGSVPVGGGSTNSNSDIALLQSLLPGVHITSGNAKQPAAPGVYQAGAPGTWNPMTGAPVNQPIGNYGGGYGLAGPPQGESWGGAPVGSNNGRTTGQGGRQHEQNQSGIW